MLFMSQARRTRNFARNETILRETRLGEEKNKAFLLPLSSASRKMPRSPRLAHKTPVMQARDGRWSSVYVKFKGALFFRYPGFM